MTTWEPSPRHGWYMFRGLFINNLSTFVLNTPLNSVLYYEDFVKYEQPSYRYPFVSVRKDIGPHGITFFNSV